MWMVEWLEVARSQGRNADASSGLVAVIAYTGGDSGSAPAAG